MFQMPQFVVLSVVAIVGAVGIAAAQDRPVVRDPRVFRSAVELTSVTATVRDEAGRLVTGLPREAFEVYEDGVRQAVTQFTNERVPVSLALLLDVSDSMFGQRLVDARAAVVSFLTDLLDPGDEFLVLAFNHQPFFLSSWTRDRDRLASMLDPIRPSGGTAGYDSVLAAIPQFAVRGNQRAALVLVSDGADTASDATIRDVRSALLRSDAFAYALAIDSPGRQAINTRVNPVALQEITDTSGGRTEVVRGIDDLPRAIASIAEELNSQYLLGYESPNRSDGQFHSIRVRVPGRDYRVRARSGYVAPARDN
jgi:Ca-activated chloride channel family protein